jgi:type II secretory pathway pseudopilin PulG
MSLNVDPVTLTLLVLLAALLIGIIAYATKVKNKARQTQRDIAAIRAVILDYFRRSGVEVTVDAAPLDNSGMYTAVVESEPMKRFRLSHIIEVTLREHVRRSCSLELDKVYWRFPIKEAAQAAQSVIVPHAEGSAANGGNNGNAGATPGGEDKKLEEVSDDYINEGLENYRNIPKPEVTELSWETFEEVATTIIGRDKKDVNGDNEQAR